MGRLFESAEKENEVIRQIKVYIQDHIETKLSREDIAEAVYLSPGYMTRLFKKETGMTLLDYIISRKNKTCQNAFGTGGYFRWRCFFDPGV